MRPTSAALAALLLAAGCAAMNDVAASDAEAPGLPPAVRDAVRADAARRGGVGLSEVRIVRAEAVTWRDGSLGCPQPGLAYTMALIPGWRLVAEAGGKPLSYHANRAGTRWLQCDPGAVQEPLPGDPAR